VLILAEKHGCSSCVIRAELWFLLLRLFAEVCRCIVCNSTFSSDCEIISPGYLISAIHVVLD